MIIDLSSVSGFERFLQWQNFWIQLIMFNCYNDKTISYCITTKFHIQGFWIWKFYYYFLYLLWRSCALIVVVFFHEVGGAESISYCWFALVTFFHHEFNETRLIVIEQQIHISTWRNWKWDRLFKRNEKQLFVIYCHCYNDTLFVVLLQFNEKLYFWTISRYLPCYWCCWWW